MKPKKGFQLNKLSWKDIISLGDPNGAGQTTLSSLMLEDCCKSKYDKNRFNEFCVLKKQKEKIKKRS